jgi:hypothetical protein
MGCEHVYRMIRVASSVQIEANRDVDEIVAEALASAAAGCEVGLLADGLYDAYGQILIVMKL